MYSSFNARALGRSVPAEQAIELAAAAGFEGVDLMVRDLMESGGDPAGLRATMDDLGLRGGSWPLPVDWRGDSARFEHDLNRLPRLAESAARLGLFRTGTWVMPETPHRPASRAGREAHWAEVADLHTRRLGAIARVLADHGGRLGLEAIGVRSVRTGRGWPFVRCLADLHRRLRDLFDAASNVGVVVDVFHLYAAGESVEAGLAWGVERVVSVHVADLPQGAVRDRRAIRDDLRGLPGENGAVDAVSALKRLNEAGYDGPVIAEPLAGCRTLEGLSLEQTARRVAAALRSVLPLATQFPTRNENRPPING
jgi:sugar phosphate isomerase/epimerase